MIPGHVLICEEAISDPCFWDRDDPFSPALAPRKMSLPDCRSRWWSYYVSCKDKCTHPRNQSECNARCGATYNGRKTSETRIIVSRLTNSAGSQPTFPLGYHPFVNHQPNPKPNKTAYPPFFAPCCPSCTGDSDYLVPLLVVLSPASKAISDNNA